MYLKYFNLLCLAFLILTGCQRPETPSIPLGSLHGTGSVYFVPIANFPPALAQQLAAFYQRKYGLSIKTLPAMQITSVAGDAGRQQLIAQQLIAQMQQVNAQQAGDPNAYLIGLTNVDMYSSDTPDWKYVFAQQQGNRLAVVSSARLDPRGYGRPADDSLLQTRLQKMVSKKIGLMYYHLPQSEDRRSVLYKSIMGPDDLDNMGKDF